MSRTGPETLAEGSEEKEEGGSAMLPLCHVLPALPELLPGGWANGKFRRFIRRIDSSREEDAEKEEEGERGKTWLPLPGEG